MLDLWPLRVVGPDQSHDVESGAVFQQSVLLQPVQRSLCQVRLLAAIHRLCGMSRQARSPRLDLDEHDRIAVACDQVEFSPARLELSGQDPHPLAAQKLRSSSLAAITKQSPRKS